MVNPTPATQLRFLQPTASKPHQPLFVYLPGMDGSGLLLRSQIPYLKSGFEIRCLSIPIHNRDDWKVLTKKTIDLIVQEHRSHPQRPIYLCGESFGGCLAMQVFTAVPQLFSRIILINPASAFHLRPWLNWASQYTNFVPAFLYSWTRVGFLSILAALPRINKSDRDDLLAVIRTLPPQTVYWRIAMLRQFQVQAEQLRRTNKPVLLVASDRDQLLPSLPEAQRLMQLLPNASISVLPSSGHACLIEDDINLYEIIKQADFLETNKNNL